MLATLSLASEGAAQDWATHLVPVLSATIGDVAEADFDGDGRSDLASSGTAGFLEVALQRDLSTETWDVAVVAVPGVDRFDALEAVDMDGDGDVDLVGTNVTRDVVVWLENQGDGQAFTLHTIASGETTPSEVVTADLDGDGDVDLAVGLQAGDEVVAYENVGAAMAWTRHSLGTADGPRELACEDMDRDGDLDLVVGSDFDDVVQVLANPGSLAAAWAATTIAVSNCVHEILVGDVDGDGWPDVVSCSFCDDVVAWHRNPGTFGGNWLTRPITAGIIDPEPGVLLDYDGDGDLDFAVSGRDVVEPAQGGVYVFENRTGDGMSWSRHAVSVLRASALDVADVDADGHQDVVFSGPAALWIENRTSEPLDFVEQVVLPVDEPASLALLETFDADGDGDQDAILNFDAGLGDGELLLAKDPGAPGIDFTTTTIAAAVPGEAFTLGEGFDADGDGDLDIVAIGSGLDWYENTTGSGTAWTAHPIGSVGSSEALAAADTDGDGDGDVLHIDGVGVLDLWENREDEGLGWQVTNLARGLGTSSDSLEVGDLDGDGDVDVVVTARLASGSVSWFENPGSGPSWTQHPIAGGGVWTGLDLVDLGADGVLDVVSIDDSRLVVGYVNDAGDGSTWSELVLAPGVVIPSLSFGPMDVFAADLDGDGDEDLLLEMYDGALGYLEQPDDGSTPWPVQTLTSTLRVIDPLVRTVTYDFDADPDVLTVDEDGLVVFSSPLICDVQASATLRVGSMGFSWPGYVAQPPVLGATWRATVLNQGTGNSMATVVGFRSPLDLFLPRFGAALLVDPSDPSGELLGLGVQAGTAGVDFSLDVPDDLVLCGFSMATQAIGLGSARLTLHNAYDLVLGH